MAETDAIERRIYHLRGQTVMLGVDLAELYQVPTRQLNQAVRRNLERFPADFMFQLNWEETRGLRSQSVTLAAGAASHFRYRPLAFTEQGVAMLSAVLQSPRAVAVSLEIVRAFVRLRRRLASHDEFSRKLTELESRVVDHDEKLAAVFDAIRHLIADDHKERRKPAIGYHTEAGTTRRTSKSRRKQS